MQKIILVRHAKALSQKKARLKKISDSDRALTKAGVRQFQKKIRSHKNLFSLFKQADLFVTSPYLRAVQTLKIIFQELKIKSKSKIKTMAKITPEDSPRYLISWLKKRKEKSIVIVSHEPFLTNFLKIYLRNEVSSEISVDRPVRIKKGDVLLVQSASSTRGRRWLKT